MNLEDIMVSEISQTHKDQYCTTLVMWRAKIVKFKKTESRIEVMKGWGKRRLGSHYLTGTEFQPAKMRRFWRWTALMAVQQCECSRLNCALTHGFKRQVSCYVCFITIKQFLIIKIFWDFSSSPVVKTLPSPAESVGSIPDQGAKTPHALGPKNQDLKQKQYCNKFNEDF